MWGGTNCAAARGIAQSIENEREGRVKFGIVGVGGVGVVEDGPLPQRVAVLFQHPLDDAFKQGVPRPDEFQVRVADEQFLVESEQRICVADLAVFPL